MAHGQRKINSKQLFTFSTFSNEYEIMSGLLDDDEMVVKAQDAKIKLMTNENGIFKLEVKKCGEMFDYDMQIKVNLCQKLLFLHQLTHNMTADCSWIYQSIYPLVYTWCPVPVILPPRNSSFQVQFYKLKLKISDLKTKP